MTKFIKSFITEDGSNVSEMNMTHDTYTVLWCTYRILESLKLLDNIVSARVDSNNTISIEYENNIIKENVDGTVDGLHGERYSYNRKSKSNILIIKIRI